MKNLSIETCEYFANRRVLENINNYNTGYNAALKDILEMFQEEISFECLYESLEVLLEHRRTIDNLLILIANEENIKKYPDLGLEYVKEIAYLHKEQHKIYKYYSNNHKKIGQFEGEHAIGIHPYFYYNNSKNEIERSIVHELIHFLDNANIRQIYPSNIYNVNRKIREEKINITLNIQAFIEMFNDIKDIDRNNQGRFNVFDVKSLIALFPDKNINIGDSTSTILRKIYNNPNIRSYMYEVRAYVGEALYAKYTNI